MALIRVLLFCLKLLTGDLTLSFEHLNTGLSLVLLNGKLSVFILCLNELLLQPTYRVLKRLFVALVDVIVWTFCCGDLLDQVFYHTVL